MRAPRDPRLPGADEHVPLFILAWAVVRLYSITAAIVMSGGAGDPASRGHHRERGRRVKPAPMTQHAARSPLQRRVCRTSAVPGRAGQNSPY
jgi:hypothetical protein